MYTAVSGIGVRTGIAKRWEEIFVTSWSVRDLITTFRRAQFKLTQPSVTGFLYLDLDVLRRNYLNFTGTLQELFVSIGNAALETTSTPLSLNVKVAMYKDAFKAGYTVTPVTHANSDSSNIALDDKHDIRLTRTNPVTDYQQFFENYLVSINGFYHQTDTDGSSGIVVTDAMKTLRQSGQNQIGLFNFQALGKLDFVPITDAMVQQNDPGEAKVTLPRDLTDKTVFLVLGGYFMTVDAAALSRVGDSSYLINFNLIPMLDRWFESNQYMDLSSLPVNSTPVNDTQIHADDVLTPEFLLAYLKLSQSFFIVLDKTEVFVNRQFIKRSRIPSLYVSYSEPKYPLVTTLGRHPEYWAVKEDGQWALTVYNNLVANRIYNTVNQNDLGGVDAGNEPDRRVSVSSAHFLEIGSDV